MTSLLAFVEWIILFSQIPNFRVKDTMDSAERWQQLMIKAQKGDDQAYGELLQLLYPVVKRFLMQKLGAAGAEDDVVQECLLALHKARHTYDPSRPFSPWMYTVVKYKAIDILRKLQKQWSREITSDEIIATKAVENSNLKEEESVDLIHEALQSLPEDMRRAVELTKLKGMNTEEASKIEGVTPVALRTRISRAYKILRKKLEKDFVQ